MLLKPFSLVLVLAAGASLPLLAAGSHDHSHSNDGDIGAQAALADATRTVVVTLGEMFFEPGSVAVKKGETVLFVIRNAGEAVHEFSLATTEMHMAHSEEMAEMIDHGILEFDRINHDKMAELGMAHDAPNSVLVEPGQSAELAWTFSGDAEIEISCNIPGHREGGMTAAIITSH